jgi:hypothetical protein
MPLEEIEKQITQLSPEELKKFSAWFDDYMADEWDRQIERDVNAGRFDRIFAEIDAEVKAGLVQPL